MNSAAAIRQVGVRIRRVREARGLSQEEAARLAGIDRSYYGRVERGLVNVSTVNLLKIAEMLDTTVGQFFPPSRRRGSV